MKNPANSHFRTPGLKEALQFIYDTTLPLAMTSKQYPNVSAILLNLSSIHQDDKEAILDLQRNKTQSRASRGTAKAAPKNWLAAPSNAGGKAIAASSDPDCVFCDEKAKAKQAKTTNEAAEAVTGEKMPQLPPEVLQAPPQKAPEFDPDKAKMREADTADKMLKFHGKGKVSNRELKDRLLASAAMVRDGHYEDFDPKWNSKRLAQYIVDSMKPQEA